MRIVHGMEQFGQSGCVVALGTFDGVHIGHAALIRETVRLAKEYHVVSAALTFDRHPLSLIRPEFVPELLTSPEEKQKKLQALGLDVLIEHPFTSDFSALPPDEFFSLLNRTLHPRAIVAGFNYTFGRKGAGDSGLLEHLCREADVSCRIMEPVCADGRPVSSSRIRALIRNGAIEEANRLLNGEKGANHAADCNNLK